jgi:acyl-CoA hydrolase
MEARRRSIPLLLLFSAVFAIIVVLKTAVNAESKHITFTEPVMVGNIVLEPDTYKVAWTGNGPEVLVTFIQGDRTVATAMANLVFEKSIHQSRAVHVKVMPDNSRVLKKISFHDRALVFDLSANQENP